MDFSVTEELATYDPQLRLAWSEDGTWPHANHFGFNEAVVASYFVLRGYHVLREFMSTRLSSESPLVVHSTALMNAVVGPEVSEYFTTELDELTSHGSGQPDLFVFREPDNPADPKIRFRDPRLWFFVEVKGPGDRVQAYQKTFWRAIAERPELGMGQDRIRLFRTAPAGQAPALKTVAY